MSPNAFSFRGLIDTLHFAELALLSRKTKHLPTDLENEQRFMRPEELDLTTHAEAIPLRVCPIVLSFHPIMMLLYLYL